ncbi:MAG: methyltransferase domain-containing protein [Acetobacteraceae bacterium]
MAASIAAMPLYTHLERIERGLAAQGIGPADPIPPAVLFPLDQWHYHGTEAIAAAARVLGLGPSSRVLDIGAGIGGPARYLAHTTGCHVTAVELQPDLHAIGVDLTRRCGLAAQVTHLCGDALQVPLPEASFDAVASWLAVLHIPDRTLLCARMAKALRPGGGCYIEDLCKRAAFAPQDLRDVREIVYGLTVTDLARYVADLRGAGFVDVVATDLTPDWAPFAAERLTAWRAGHAAYASVHGEGAYAAQDLFYTVIARLYASGSLGGIRLVARVP